MLTTNPARERLTYAAEKQKVSPGVLIDLIAIVAYRADAGATKSKRSAWKEFRAAFKEATGEPLAGGEFRLPSDHYDLEPEEAEKLLAWVSDQPWAQNPSALDPLLPWLATQLTKIEKERLKIFSVTHALTYEEDARAKKLEEAYLKLTMAAAGLEDAPLVEWFSKKKPNLTKMDAWDALSAAIQFELDRVPEVDYEFPDGWKIVKLTTKTQIGREGEAMSNCLRPDSSYHDEYCAAMREGDAEFFSLRDKAGRSHVSIEWKRGDKEPAQVYGPNNEKPSYQEEKKISEWAKKRGGHYKGDPFADLSASERETAQWLVSEYGYEQDEDTAAIAEMWTSDFGSEAIDWIDATGENREFASALAESDVTPDMYKSLPGVIIGWLGAEEPHRRLTDEQDDVVTLGVLVNEFQRLRYSYPAEEATADVRQAGFGFEMWPPRTKASQVPLPADIAAVLSESQRRDLYKAAWQFVQNGWSGSQGRDYAEEAANWWVSGFNAHDAGIYEWDMAKLDPPRHNGISVAEARELRDRGVTADEVLDAVQAYPGTVNIHDIGAVVRLVEARRLLPNKRRSSKRRSSKRRR